MVFKSDEDDSQAEVFIPKQKSPVILDKATQDGAGTLKHDELTLKQAKGMYKLEENGNRVFYKGGRKALTMKITSPFG